MKKSLLLLSSTALLMSNLFGTVYSDGTNPEDWKLYTTTQGEVGENDGAIEFKGNGKQGFYLPLNIKCDANQNEYELSWKMKSKRYSQTLIQIMTKDGIRYLSYYPTKNTHGKSGRFLKFGLDKELNGLRSRDGQWHTLRRDIKLDLKEYEPNNELVEIKALLVRGTVLIDDVEVVTPLAPVTDKEKFVKAMELTQRMYWEDELKYFPEIGIGTSTSFDLAYESTTFFAFSDEEKDSATKINIEALTDPYKAKFDISTDAENKQLNIYYNCKPAKNLASQTLPCLNQNERYHDIYDVSNPLNPVLISTKIEK